MTSPWLEFDLSIDPLKFIFSRSNVPPRIRPDNGAIYSGAVRIFSVGSSFRNAPPLLTEFSRIGERHPLWGCNSTLTWLSVCIGKLLFLRQESSLSTSNTRTPNSFGAGASHGDACNTVPASALPCCHRFSIDERLKS